MKLTLRISYQTHWGQRIFVSGNIPELGNGDKNKALEMSYFNGEQWELALNIKANKKFQFEYSYFVKDEKDKILDEWGGTRVIEILPTWGKTYVIQDQWKAVNNSQNAFSTSPFTDVFFKGLSVKSTKTTYKKSISHIFNLRLPFDISGLSVCIIGGTKLLGDWDWDKAVELKQISTFEYSLMLDLSSSIFPIEYKYGLYNAETKKVIELEAGDNRKLTFAPKNKEEKVIVNDENFIREFDQWKGAGVAIPVFSLRSKKSFGTGEFNDIKLLVDWAVKTDMKLIQILPINDTIATHTWVDSYPYAAISVFALHPIYLNLEKAGKLASKLTQNIITELGDKLNQNDTIDYETVMNTKLRYIKQIYSESKEALKTDVKFKTFVKENSSWLKPYAAFSFLRDLYSTVDFSKWGKYSEFSSSVSNEINDEKSQHFADVELHYFTQYHLHLQLLEASDYAHKKGIILKGDIPIGIYRNSVDAWTEPHLYNMEMQAGAPPDDFAVKGQNWGFPTYNWDEMAKDDYLWWTQRLQKLSAYFDTFRIDHILGFFRIWQIPMHAVEGILGYFNPALPIKVEEFSAKGLDFDASRYCKPYIREHILINIFGDKKDYIKNTFLVDKGYGVFEMKDGFETQREVEKYFKVDESTTSEERAEIDVIKKGLYDLIADIMFIEVDGENGKDYHPRHTLQHTHSFMELDDNSKQIVDNIYNDYFYHRQEEFWKDRAMEKLPSIKNATNMLICGEDLGMVPSVVPGVMDELGILSLEVQRMPKDTGIEFFHPASAPYLSVVTSSSHDMSTIRGWWEEDYERSQRFFNNILGHQGLAPYYADSWLVKEVVNQHLYSPAMWAILPIQDFVGMNETLRLQNAKAEQINIPAIIPHYWRYRFHLNLEDLLKEDDFNNSVKEMINRSGR